MAIAWRSSGVGSGGFSSSESSAFKSKRPIPAAVAPAAEEDCRVAICGLRLRTVTVGLNSCFSGTSEEAS